MTRRFATIGGILIAITLLFSTSCKEGYVTPADVKEWLLTEASPPVEATDEAAADISDVLNRMYWDQVWSYVDGFNKPLSPIPAGYQSTMRAIRWCESKGNYSINTGNGYYGAYQFSLSTWRGQGGSGYPHNASPWEQDFRAWKLYNYGKGAGHWPNCP